LGGPGWLRSRRVEALEGFRSAALPREAEEEWHYSEIDQLDLGSFRPPLPDGAPSRGAADLDLPEAAIRLLGELGPRAGLVVTVDATVVAIEGSKAGEHAGVKLGALADAPCAPMGLVGLDGQSDALGLLAEAFVQDGALVEVPSAARVEEPILVLHLVTARSAGGLVAPRTIVMVGEGAEASVVELVVSSDDPVLVLPATTCTVASRGRLAHMSAQQLGLGAMQLGSHRHVLQRDATLTAFVAALGGSWARQRVHSALVGEGAQSDLLAVYFADGHQLMSFRTVQEHVAPRTKSELVFKGAVAGEARSAYSGLVSMRKGAQKADASQTNRNLVLSEGARADSVPNLDIEENDVRCSHASAVGPVDADQRFYLETRGVPTEAAERLVLLGFFEDLLFRSPHAGFAAHVRQALPARLAAATGGAQDEEALASLGGRR